YPDWLLLKKGDTWTDQALGQIKVGGRSSNEPMLVASYGTGARPLIKTPSGVNGVAASGGGGGAAGINYSALVGIEFYSYTRDPNSPGFSGPSSDVYGIVNWNAFQWLLIEDCKFSFYTVDVNMDSHLVGSNSSNLTVRRNVIVDAY